MDSWDFPSGKSPRRELQGPRPTPLKVRKDSHKIRKPPVVPQPAYQLPAQPPRQPVIIYTVSPKVIHTHPSEFMTLVQRLTGSSSSSASASSSAYTSIADNGGAPSPAARFATMEKINKSPEMKKAQSGDHMGLFEGMEIRSEIMRTGFPGILSPGPGSLQPIPTSFFSPPSDPSPLSSFFQDLSPVLQGNYKSYIEGNFMMPSPSSSFLSPQITSPTPSLDIFNNLFNL
ncbi:nuclear speckle RNA-binding protein B-like [Cornus florida]|uniref:nuclear speckle RNA-binding protein B-like n=1 Tax=Cornus florida TaxID=4283 RepID=UPI00289B9B9D|nr:nuclear speckle RNA-binding protein B-like [Cornus florida]